MFLEDTYRFCNFAKLLKEPDRAPCPIIRLSRINFLKHILPLVQRHRTLFLIFIVKTPQLLMIDCSVSLDEFALIIAMRSQPTIGTYIWVFPVNQFLYTSYAHFSH